MSETPQPYDTGPKFPESWGETVPAPIEAIRARINAALRTVEQPRPVYRLRVERVGNEVKVTCPCGKTRLLSTQHINVFCQAFDRFLEEHSWCEPGDAHAE